MRDRYAVFRLLFLRGGLICVFIMLKVIKNLFSCVLYKINCYICTHRR